MQGIPANSRVKLTPKPLATTAGFLIIAAAVVLAVMSLTSSKSQAFAGFVRGQVIHSEIEYSTVSPETAGLDMKREEYWTLVGDNNTVSKLRVFLRDSTGRLLQDGFIDGDGTQVSTHFVSDGRTVSRRVPEAPSLLMWTQSEVQEKLLNQGFSLVGQTVIAGWPAEIYERVSPFALAPGESVDQYSLFRDFEGPTQSVQRVYIGTRPYGLDLGEEGFYRDSTGKTHLSFSRHVTTLEIVDQADAPAGVFDWARTGQ